MKSDEKWHREKLTKKVTRYVLFGALWISILMPRAGLASGGNWDHALTLDGRSYPVGGSIGWGFGYAIPLWGSLPSGKKSTVKPWYGYIRPAFSLVTAGFYNYASAEIEFFPISILGISTGGSYTSVTEDYANYECDSYHCRGLFTGQFVKGHLTLGWKSVFFYGQFKYEKLSHNKSDQSFLIVDHAIRGEEGKDDLRRLISVLGYRWNESWSSMLISIDAETVGFSNSVSSERSRMLTLNMQYQVGRWSFLLGGGLFDSPLKSEEATVIGRLRWQIRPTASIY